MDNQIAKESIEMAQHGLQVRNKRLKEGKLWPEYNPEMESVHKKNGGFCRICQNQLCILDNNDLSYSSFDRFKILNVKVIPRCDRTSYQFILSNF